MANKEHKYIVVKRKDLNYLSDGEKESLEDILEKIQICRGRDNKPRNNYVVINQDEPYALAVWDIIIAFENQKEEHRKYHEGIVPRANEGADPLGG